MLKLEWKRILPGCALLLAAGWADAAEPPTISVGYAYDSGGQYSAVISGSDPDGGPTTVEFSSLYLHTYFRYRHIATGEGNDQTQWVGGPIEPPEIAMGFLPVDEAGVIQGLFYFAEAYDAYGPSGAVRVENGIDQYYVNARVRDTEGLVSQTVGILLSAHSWPSIFTGALYLPPVALDLDGDGVETVDFRSSKVAFQASKSAPPSITGWIAADDAMLVLDRNRDGVINDASEISFINDFRNAKSDLEGLRAYDSNGNGLLDIRDARYGEFLAWRDANQDGKSQPDELRALLYYDIQSIELTPTPTSAMPSEVIDNLITGTAKFTRSDGTTGTVGDVSLAYLGSQSAQPKPAPFEKQID